MEPSVSVPTAPTHKPALTAAAEPLLEPLGFRLSTCGLRVWPPMLLHPLVERVERKLAHSDKLVLPNTRAPACRRPATVGASSFGLHPARASEPPVVGRAPAVTRLSLIRMGAPNSGRSGPGPCSSRERGLLSPFGGQCQHGVEHGTVAIQLANGGFVVRQNIGDRDISRGQCLQNV